MPVAAPSPVSVDLVRAALRSEDFPMPKDPELLATAQGRYERWLLLSARHPDRALAPSRDIDAMWHLHMLHPRQYASDCERLFGEILDHDGGFGATEEERPLLEAAFAETAALWKAAYGEEYVGEGRGSDMVKCTRNCVSRCQRACKTK